MKHLDLFSGIGGFAFATEMVWDNVEHIFVENDPFCQAVLRKHWKTSAIHGNIKEFTWNGYVQNASKEQDSTKTSGGVSSVVARKQKSTTQNTEPSAPLTPKTDGGSNDSNSTKCSEINAPVVERPSRSSSPSTISTDEEDTKSVDIPDTSISSKRAHLKTSTKSSASTVTAPKDSTENAPTNYERPFLLTGGFPCQPFSQGLPACRAPTGSASARGSSASAPDRRRSSVMTPW